jgi:hypothetical protein
MAWSCMKPFITILNSNYKILLTSNAPGLSNYTIWVVFKWFTLNRILFEKKLIFFSAQ